MIKKLYGKYAFLSNFYPTKFKFMGKTYRSSEHFFQAAKVRLHDDAAGIRMIHEPGQARRTGRAVEIRNDWESIKFDVMRLALRLKFQKPALRAALLATGETFIAEENNHGDTFWGQVNGIGSNMLGLLLMKLRTQFQLEDERELNDK